MKKVLLTIAAIALFAAPASAQVLSLWADEGMTACDITTMAPYQMFNLYVFLEPGADGAFAVEYKLTTPAGHFSPSSVINPVVSAATIGTWINGAGISAPFTSCQADVFWVINLSMMGPDTNPGFYVLGPNDTTGFMGVAICPGTRPMVDGSAYNNFGFNDGCVVGTEETSWGAIKNLMD